MVLDTSSPTDAVDTMKPALSPQATNRLADTVVHANVQVDKVELASKQDVGASQQITLIEQANLSSKDAKIQERAADMQMWWDEAIAKNMNFPDGYTQVAVLIIKWADPIDELKTRIEAEELDAVFRQDFHFHTETVELNIESKPQHQLNRYLTAFVEQHDGPNNLLIVYYTGHGKYDENLKFLQLTAGLKNEASFRKAHANWNKAEDVLLSDDVEGDVLTILDTCYSSNIAKSGKEETRTFELLSACSIDAVTAGPGDNSFTRALIDALRDLLKEGRTFNTFHLNARICHDSRRHDTPSHLWHRLQQHDRHICLAPQKPQATKPKVPGLQDLPRGFLTLRFALRKEYVTQLQIEDLTKSLSKALDNKTFIRRIDWLGIKTARTTHFGRTALAILAITQWKIVVNRKRRRAEYATARWKRAVKRSRKAQNAKPLMEVSARPVLPSPMTKHPRDGDEEMPEAKRKKIMQGPASSSYE